MAIVRAEMLEHEASDQWFIDHFTSQGSRDRFTLVHDEEFQAFPRH